jgi:peptidoglycan hydrolase-like protein with peptidoglycan-binding domain
MTRLRTFAAVLLAATATIGLAACGDDDSESTTTSTTSTTASDSAQAAATARFDKQIQQELADVGCYKGEIDGILGSASDAAILEFQKAAGLSADGELGPQTEDALKKAVDEGEKVCSESTTTTTAATTTTGGGSGTAPCTATAIAKGLPDEGETITSYVCSDGYAAGSVSGDAKFLLVDDNGTWVAPSTDPCGAASAGIPPVILEDGCDS